MSAKLFESALRVTDLWFIEFMKFGQAVKTLTLLIDFNADNRFEVSEFDGMHGAHGPVSKTYRHLNVFQHFRWVHIA